MHVDEAIYGLWLEGAVEVNIIRVLIILFLQIHT